MRNPILRTSIILLSLSLSLLAKVSDDIELALTAIGAGSAAEMKNRLCTDRITVFNDEARTQAIAALPATVRDHRVTQGKLLRRVEPLFAQVLQLHERTRASQQPALVLFEHEFPTAQVWRGCVLLVSTGLAEPLYDGELAGIFAHELSHAYFEDEMAVAQRQRDAQTMRVVELKCDAVAILSVKLLGYNPALYLKGLQRIQVINKQKSQSSGIFQSHPELVARAQFAERLIKALD